MTFLKKAEKLTWSYTIVKMPMSTAETVISIAISIAIFVILLSVTDILVDQAIIVGNALFWLVAWVSIMLTGYQIYMNRREIRRQIES